MREKYVRDPWLLRKRQNRNKRVLSLEGGWWAACHIGMTRMCQQHLSIPTREEKAEAARRSACTRRSTHSWPRAFICRERRFGCHVVRSFLREAHTREDCAIIVRQDPRLCGERVHCVEQRSRINGSASAIMLCCRCREWKEEEVKQSERRWPLSQNV
jgi:hypothetical protein